MGSRLHATGDDVCTEKVSHQGASETGSGDHGSSRSAAAGPAVTSRIARQAAARIILLRIFSQTVWFLPECALVSEMSSGVSGCSEAADGSQT